jgi:TolB-like protein/class 3 adenylate cyclase
VERRLTTILAADIAGFSRLIGLDEEGTLAAQRSHRIEFINPLLEQHSGRVANTAGDSLLIEFSSAVEAVRCALAVQEGMEGRNASISEDLQIVYRVGINVGDVVAEGDDLLGDGVNVAARLEALAPPGGIILSRTVRDQVRDRLELDLADLGEISVKNIARPVRAFQVLKKGEAAMRTPKQSAQRQTVLAVIAALFAVLIGAGLYWQSQHSEVGSEDTQNAVLALPDKPSIAVLPFENLSDDPSKVWLGDGMAEDIITDLSKVSGLFVIARNSSFHYRGGDLDLRRVGRELGVRYLLEGSVRRAGDRLRINAQLIDAESGGHIWADRYDGTASDIFALQDRVTARVVESLALVLTKTEAEAVAARETDNPAAHDAFLQGLSHMRQGSPEGFAEARRWFDKALLIDPTYPRALGARAYIYLAAARRGWEAAVGIKGRADAIAATYAALKHPSALAHATEAALLLSRPDPMAAREAVDLGLALDPNDPDLHVFAAAAEAGLGNHERAVELAERSLRLDPRYPPSYLTNLGTVRHVAGETEAALALYNRALDRNLGDWHPRIRRAAILAELGRIKEAAADLEIARKNWPESWGARQFIAPVLAWYWGRSFGAAYVERLEKAFLAAGLPRVPEGFDLQQENRLDLAAHKALLGDGARLIGRCCGGEWMTDQHADDTRVEYFDGVARTGRSTRIFYANGAMEVRRHDRLEQNRYCQPYRNPGGSNETLDAYFAVCANGVFPFGVFPLP